MTMRDRFPAAILLATIVAGLLTTATAVWKAPSPMPASGERSPQELRRAADQYRDYQAARDDS